jgi:hypothetical protein
MAKARLTLFLAALAAAFTGFGAPRAQAVVAAPAHVQIATCHRGYYRNSRGNCVHRPASSATLTPQGATAHCRDGTYSYSQSASGTCSHHGGVGTWLHHP